jgi:GH15 family glucan-1,4-alpha-glucosidase
MAGERVSGYGDPQVDGTAATALAVLRLVEDPRRALDIAGPFLAFLAGGATGQPGFDLWELTVGASFHAMNLARRALRRAAVVARAAADVAEEGYRAAAERYGLLLSAFHDPERGYLVHVLEPIPPWFAATSRLDVSVVGSVLLGFGPQDATDEVFGVADARVAATAAAVERHFAHRWPVNAAWHQAGNLGSGIGRFPEDCNDGMGSTHGNPWPVASLWLAQFHLRQLEVRPDRSPGDIASAVALASGYLAFVLEHASPASISEQIDAVTGRPRGVALLAWAHAELVVTVLALQRWLG